jgi:hypothetical protein
MVLSNAKIRLKFIIYIYLRIILIYMCMCFLHSDIYIFIFDPNADLIRVNFILYALCEKTLFIMLYGTEPRNLRAE